jgi:hypothetical protein
VASENKAAAESAFADKGFTIVTGHRYLGGFIGDNADLDNWLSKKASAWELTVKDLASVATRYPQTAYTGLQKSLQNEWQFVQRVKPGIAAHFSGIEKALSRNFLPALFGEPLDKENDHRRSLAGLPVKHDGIAIPDLTTTATEYYEVSTLVCSHLIEAIRGRVPFQHADHLSVQRATIQQLRSRKKTKHDQELATLLTDIRCHTRRQIETGKETGAWLTVLPSTINGMELSAQEFRDKLLIRYACQPPDLLETCDGCGHTNSVGHALDCKTGSLIIQRHNEITNEFADLCGKVLTPPAVHDEPSIYPDSCISPTDSRRSTLSNQPVLKCKSKLNDEDRGDLLVRGLWQRGTHCVIDV